MAGERAQLDELLDRLVGQVERFLVAADPDPLEAFRAVMELDVLLAVLRQPAAAPLELPVEQVEEAGMRLAQLQLRLYQMTGNEPARH